MIVLPAPQPRRHGKIQIFLLVQSNVAHTMITVMNINKCTYNGPDDDGDFSFEIDVSYQNDHEVDIDAMKYGIAFFNAAGSYAGGDSSNFEESYIESGQSESLSLYIPYINKSLFDPSEDGAKIHVQASFCSRTSKKIGPFPMPKQPGEMVSIGANDALIEGVQIVGGNIIVGEPDDDGECLVEVRIAIHNTTDKYIHRVSLKATIMDELDEPVISFEDYEPIPPGEIIALRSSDYIKKGKLKKCAEAKIILSVDQSIACSTAEVCPTKE